MFQVFISASSKDYDYARRVYDFLKARGIQVFFSDVSLTDLADTDYRRAIDRALDDAVHMVVVASNRENVRASWVEAEWGLFINEKRSGRKTGNLVSVVCGELAIADLPPSLRYYQALRLDDLEKLPRFVGGAPSLAGPDAAPTSPAAAPPAGGLPAAAPENERKTWPLRRAVGWLLLLMLVGVGGSRIWFLLRRETPPPASAARPLPPASATEAAATPSGRQASPGREMVVEFPDVDTSRVPGHVVAAAPYLHEVGITVRNLQPARSEVVLINNRAIYQGEAVHPTTSQNLLTQVSTDNEPASFTLKFAEPVDSVSFTRPALYPATNSGITHPAWSAHALDADGNELSAQSEGLTRSFSDVPANRYTLRAPGFARIAAVRFDSDPRLNGQPFAAFSAILIERLTFARQPVAAAR